MEGTAAHELASHCLTMGFDAKRFLGRKINIFGKDAATIFLAEGAPDGVGIYDVTAEMVEGIQDFLDLVRKKALGSDIELFVERRVHTPIHDDCHGTADAIIYNAVTTVLHVFDLKYGRGVPVEIEGNKQLLIYASGARKALHNRQIGQIQIHIFQPRCPHPAGSHRFVTITPADLDAAEKGLSLAAEHVDRAEDDYEHRHVENWNGDFLRAGDHCRFCKASATCPARSDQALEVAQTEFGATTELRPPEGMSSDELASVLTKARQIQHWIKTVEEYAAAEASAGRMPTGFKQVAGRSTRSWSNEQKLKNFLPVFCSVSVADLLEEPKLLSPAKLEKLLPKDERAALKPFITKSASGTLLVPDDDPRPAIKPDAAEEFGSTSSG